MMEITSGLAIEMAGVAAAEFAHSTKEPKSAETYLQELCLIANKLLNYLEDTPQNKQDEHVTLYTYLNQAQSIRYNKYLALYVLVNTASTFTLNVSGLGSFVWTPTVGSYTRWRFPEGTTIQLLTPSQAQFPIEILHTDDRTL